MSITNQPQSISLEHIARGITKPCPPGTPELGVTCSKCNGTGITHPYHTLGDWRREHNGSEWPSLVWASYETGTPKQAWWDNAPEAQHLRGGLAYVHALTLDEAFELLEEAGWYSYKLSYRSGDEEPYKMFQPSSTTLFQASKQSELLDKVLSTQSVESHSDTSREEG